MGQSKAAKAAAAEAAAQTPDPETAEVEAQPELNECHCNALPVLHHHHEKGISPVPEKAAAEE